MAHNIRWTLRALSSLAHIAEYIAKDSPRNADELIAEIKEKTTSLSTFPLMGRVGEIEDTREFFIRRNYLITYRVRDGNIEVLQVWHVAQDR